MNFAAILARLAAIAPYIVRTVRALRIFIIGGFLYLAYKVVPTVVNWVMLNFLKLHPFMQWLVGTLVVWFIIRLVYQDGDDHGHGAHTQPQPSTTNTAQPVAGTQPQQHGHGHNQQSWVERAGRRVAKAFKLMGDDLFKHWQPLLKYSLTGGAVLLMLVSAIVWDSQGQPESWSPAMFGRHVETVFDNIKWFRQDHSMYQRFYNLATDGEFRTDTFAERSRYISEPKSPPSFQAMKYGVLLLVISVLMFFRHKIGLGTEPGSHAAAAHH